MPPVPHSRDLQAIRSAFGITNVGDAALAQQLSDVVALVYPGIGALRPLRKGVASAGAAGATVVNIAGSTTVPENKVWVVRRLTAFHNDAANATLRFEISAASGNVMGIAPEANVAANVHVSAAEPLQVYPGEILRVSVVSAGFGAGAVLSVRAEFYELPDSALLPGIR